jgi:uroporphyrinogen decarboxylase
MSDKRGVSARDRVLTSLQHHEPDRIPFDLGGNPNAGIHVIAYRRLLDMLGYDFDARIDDVITQQALIDEEVLKRLNVDVRRVGCPIYPGENLEIRDEGEYTSFFDDYGIKWVKPKHDGLYYDMRRHPLSGSISKNDILSLRMPPLPNQKTLTAMRERARKHSDAGYAVIVPEPGGGIFELATWIRGFEDIYIDLAANTQLVEILLDKLMEYRIAYWELILDQLGEYVHLIAEADDVATQFGMMFDPRVFRSILKPRYRRLIDLIKRKTNQRVFVCFHSCGAVREIIPDLVDVGVDALNPVQVSAAGMDTKSLKRDFGEEITFWGGGIDTQRVLAGGTEQQVRDEVKRRIDDLAPGGGFVFATVHNVQADVPPENLLTMWETFMEYSEY